MARQSKNLKKKIPAAPAKPPAVSVPSPPTRSAQHSKISRPTPDRRQLVISSVLFIAVLAVFWPCLHNDFINCDDDLYVVENTHVQQSFSMESVRWAFTTFEATNWHPLTWLSNILACDLFGLKPAGHHFFNILLHAINAVLLFLILELMTGAKWKCLAVAALFAFHPLRVESVAWVAERKDVMSTAFWFLAIWAHVRYARELQAGGQFRRFYGLALGFFVLALLSKPMVVTLPFTLLLLDYWPLGRLSKWRIAWLEKIPYFVLTVISCVITYHAQKSGGAVGSKIPVYLRCETAVLGYSRYIGKMFWPSNLALQYPYPHHWPIAAVWLAAAGLGVVTVLVVLYGKKQPWLPVGWFWYVGTLVPVIGLVQVGLQSMADRYTYVPGIGITLILVWGLSALWQRWHLPIPVLTTVTLAALCVCIYLTQRQIGYWQNGETVFTHAVEVTTDNGYAYEYLGDYEFKHGKLKEAIDAFDKTLSIDPGNEKAHSGIAYILFFNAGQRDAGIQELETAVKLKPNSPMLRQTLGMFYKEQQRYPEAEGQLREAIKLQPVFPEADVGLAYICMKDGRREEAVSLLKQALQARPDLKVAEKMLRQAESGALQ